MGHDYAWPLLLVLVLASIVPPLRFTRELDVFLDSQAILVTSTGHGALFHAPRQVSCHVMSV